VWNYKNCNYIYNFEYNIFIINSTNLFIYIKKREKGNRKNIIVVSEGATDKSLNPITATYIKEVIEQNLNIDTRITTLGHIQREGIPCAYDRFLVIKI